MIWKAAVLFCVASIFIGLSPPAHGQKVGIALSGGGVKGLAHVGVLKALEENEIPIDCVTGTSMGGIVGGFYAAGFSPYEIEEIALSDDFLRWTTGLPEKGQNYFYYNYEKDGTSIQLRLAVDSVGNVQVNTTLINDQPINFMLAEKLAQPSAIAKNNFDSLFIPLRVVAADVFSRKKEILGSGQLNNAIRATMSIPFIYPPARVGRKYLFDGGIYDNFPVDVLLDEFKPDVIIGVNVDSQTKKEYPYGKDEKSINQIVTYILANRSEPNQIPETGIYIQPNVKELSVLDFDKAFMAIDSGYRQTMRQMEEIKRKINRRITCEDIAEKRNRFNNKKTPLVVDSLAFTHFNTQQQRYVRRFFPFKKNKSLYFSEIKNGFNKLVSEEYFRNLYPTLIETNPKKNYTMYLDRRRPNNFAVSFGGVIASRNISQIYLGIKHFYFNRIFIHSQVNFTAGSFYKAVTVGSRIDFSSLGRFYLYPYADLSSWNFFEGLDYITEKSPATVYTRINRHIGLNVGFPFSRQYKLEIRGAYVNNSNRYLNTPEFSSNSVLDLLSLSGVKFGVYTFTDRLNRKQYPTQGYALSAGIDYFNIREHLTPGNTSVLTEPQSAQHQWIKLRFDIEQYIKLRWYTLGYAASVLISGQPFFSNYYGTLVNTPGYYPFQDTPTTILKNFHATNFISGGLKQIIVFKKRFELRLEGHAFKPILLLKEIENQKAFYDDTDYSSLFFAASAAIVFQTTVGPIALSANYYKDKQRQFGILLHAGFLLFKKNTFE